MRSVRREGRVVVIRIIVLRRVGESLLRLAVYAPQLEDFLDAVHVYLSFRREAFRSSHVGIALVGKLLRHLGQALTQDRNRFSLVLWIQQEIDSAGVSLDEGLHLIRVLGRPRSARRANQALVMSIRVDRVLQHVEAVRLRNEVEWGKEKGAVVLLFLERLPALQYAARLLYFVVGFIEAFALH